MTPKLLISLLLPLVVLFIASQHATSEEEIPDSSMTAEDQEEVEEIGNVRQGKKRIGSFRRKEDLTSILFPGASPEEYRAGEEIPIWVDLVDSKKTHLPYQYFNLPVCDSLELRNPNNLKKFRKNLGQRLQGYNRRASPYEIISRKDMSCTTLCSVPINAKKAKWLRYLVERQYRIHMNLDGLPVLMKASELNYAVRGFPVGFKAPPSYTGLDRDEYFLYNHIKFTIEYNQSPNDKNAVRIVGFHAHPVSIAHQGEVQKGLSLKTCGAKPVENDKGTFLALSTSGSKDVIQVIYSYEVYWEESNTEWSDRWDIYLIGSPDDEVHLFSILNSFMVCVFLSGTVATIIIRTLKKDIASFNEMRASLGSDFVMPEEESGWKLMHGDVFRPPQNFNWLLCVAVGTGAQIVTAIGLTLFCGFVGILSPMNKGQTLTLTIMLYVLTGSVAGYTSSRLYKYFDKGTAWNRTTLLTATAFPAILVTMFLVLDIFLAFQGAATAVSIWTILSIFLLWVCVSAPLVFAGSYFGCRAKKISVPTKTNQIARVIPETSWYLKPVNSFFLGGVLPFGNVCIEVYFVMSALWLHQIYYVMGFLFAVLIVLMVSTAEMCIVICYLQLSAGDHQWWWSCFFNGASVGLYLFMYSIWFLFQKMDLVGFLPVMIYITYMSMISMALSLFCGAVGVLSCFWFIRSIYGAIKVD